LTAFPRGAWEREKRFTILGSGEVALIVDVPGLMGQIEHERAAGESVSFPRSGVGTQW